MQERNSGKRARRNTRFTMDNTPIFESRDQRKQVGPLQAKTEAQAHLLMEIINKDIIFSIGPAGTGKTYVATSYASEELFNKRIEKIIITRPMLACDEEIGHLPGTEDEKYHPWVSPMIDVLEKRLGKGFADYCLSNKTVLAQPLMMMRGSSFEDSIIILDEAQNTTPEQMKMFLTRIGKNCKMIINGDLAQSDLKDRHGEERLNGLRDALSRLRAVPQVGVAEFTVEDIVRHGIIRKILECY